MAYTAPRTWVLGELVTAAMMNTYIRDNISFLWNKPRFRYRNTATQSIPTSAAAPYTTIVFDTQDYNVGSGTMGGSAGAWTGLYTVQQTGLWLFFCSTQWASSGSGGQRTSWINKPGLDGASQLVRSSAGRSTAQDPTPSHSAVGATIVAAGQIMRTKAYQTTGVALNLAPTASDENSVCFAGMWVST